jgi:Bifunctional DNA primase/polymerase, N-terminal
MTEIQTKMAHIDANDTGQQAEIQCKDTVSAPLAQVLQAELFSAAQCYHAAGHNVIWWRNDSDPKKQWPRWKQWKQQRQTADELTALFKNVQFDRIAIICTDGMEVIDIDVKADPTGKIFNEFVELSQQDETADIALTKCVQVRTKSGGWHFLYRAANAQPNQKLAYRAGCKEAMIETRGPGGLIYVAPSPGYEVIQGNYCNLPTLTDEQRNALIGIARLLHEPENEAPEPHYEPATTSGGKSPWTDFNERHTVEEVAERYGYRVVSKSGDKLYLNRPGAKNSTGVDATILTTRAGNRRFYAHSTSVPYDTGKLYSAFAMYAVEQHRGDIKAAVIALRRDGYGDASAGRSMSKRANTSEQSGKPSDFVGCDALIERDGRYYWTAAVKLVYKEVEISNFVIEPLYHLLHPETPKRVFTVRNIYGETKTICAVVKDIAACEALKGVIEGQGNFVASFAARQYSAIKEFWFYHEKVATEVGTLGHIPGTNLYAFANGIFDGQDFLPVNEFGIVEANDQRWFIPAFSNIYADNPGMFTHERKFYHNPTSAVTFEHWAKLVCTAFSENDNGRVGVVFACAALFRSLISDHTNFFPLLFLFGMPKTGKSTFRDAILHLFGQPMDAISLGSASSPKGFNRRLAQRRDAVQVFEEYKNTIPLPLIEMLKSVYDLMGYERAQTSNDNRTQHTPVLSAVIVAGQELPVKENALFSRTVTTEFVSNQFSPDQVAAHSTLTDLQKGNGITGATIDILRQRPHMEADFIDTYREMRLYLKCNKAPANLSLDALETDPRLPHNIDDRSINNTAVLLATYSVLSKHLAFPFSLAQLIDTLTNKLKSQVEIMNDATEISQFWRAFEVLVSQGKLIEGRDFKTDEKDKECWHYIALTTVFPAYVEHQRKIGATALDEATLTRYLKRQPEFKPSKDGRATHQIWLGKNTRCFAFCNLKI